MSGATCKSCGAPIRFVKTPKGKWMPVDPQRVTTEDIDGDTIVTDDGEILKGKEAASTVGYVPHWLTCVSPELFRRRG